MRANEARIPLIVSLVFPSIAVFAQPPQVASPALPAPPHPPPPSLVPSPSLLHAALIISCRPLKRNILSHLNRILFLFFLVVIMNFPPDPPEASRICCCALGQVSLCVWDIFVFLKEF